MNACCLCNAELDMRRQWALESENKTQTNNTMQTILRRQSKTSTPENPMRLDTIRAHIYTHTQAAAKEHKNTSLKIVTQLQMQQKLCCVCVCARASPLSAPKIHFAGAVVCSIVVICENLHVQMKAIFKVSRLHTSQWCGNQNPCRMHSESRKTRVQLNLIANCSIRTNGDRLSHQRIGDRSLAIVWQINFRRNQSAKKKQFTYNNHSACSLWTMIKRALDWPDDVQWK